MESIDCALELGYNPVKVRDSDFDNGNNKYSWALMLNVFQIMWLLLL